MDLRGVFRTTPRSVHWRDAGNPIWPDRRKVQVQVQRCSRCGTDASTICLSTSPRCVNPAGDTALPLPQLSSTQLKQAKQQTTTLNPLHNPPVRHDPHNGALARNLNDLLVPAQKHAHSTAITSSRSHAELTCRDACRLLRDGGRIMAGHAFVEVSSACLSAPTGKLGGGEEE